MPVFSHCEDVITPNDCVAKKVEPVSQRAKHLETKNQLVAAGIGEKKSDENIKHGCSE